ncbi:hypothetical protein ACIP29_25865 [Streptomyces coelicoflavus]|uniref:hypothetical protein n=1 Tax=Streptomyces coelicoflavus TaxID=285562 RepID=UPI00380EA5B9
MAPKTERIQFLRAVRQLRCIRSFYAAAILPWAGSAAWTGLAGPREAGKYAQAVLLLVVFTALLVTATLALRRLAVPATGRPRAPRCPAQAAEHSPSRSA